MLFNSYSFLFSFLPISLLGFFLAGRLGKLAGAAWLTACSLFFYAWWDHRYLALLLASICVNYVVGGFIAKHAQSRRGQLALSAGITANLALLAYFKYADFFLTSLNSAIGTEWPVLGIVLPIGISFFTFTQIAFLADAYAGKVTEYRFVYYALFVTYFPHLIAGPVLHHKEMMPQFDEDQNYRPVASNFAIGLSIFALGLAKKVLIADNLSVYAAPVFSVTAPGPTLFLAWGGALAYTFQLYFDFSGYSDMAIGLSRLFGVRLPLNFNSPYKATNIAEFWRGWHMTLSRFLRDYLYIPLGGNRRGRARRMANLMTTMLLGGLWHGAGWGFIIWGGLHGVFLAIHQFWQTLRTRIVLAGRLANFIPRPLAIVAARALTFVCVVFAWVYFRSPDLATANRVTAGMLGGWGASLPEPLLTRMPSFIPLFEKLGIGSYLGGGSTFVETWSWIVLAALVAFFAPNTQEIMGRFEPALPEHGQTHIRRARCLLWLPTRRQAILSGLLFALGILALARPTEFLYFQF